MKPLISTIALLALCACGTIGVGPGNEAPKQVTNSLAFGGIKVTSSGLPVTSGNAAAIASGSAGDGGGAAAGK